MSKEWIQRFNVIDVKTAVDCSLDELKEQLCLKLKLPEITSVKLARRSLDARKSGKLQYVWQLSFELAKPLRANDLHKQAAQADLQLADSPGIVSSPKPGDEVLRHVPLIVGSGPAGLFCAYRLAKHGYQPLILERGGDVRRRSDAVQSYWEGGPLDPQSNVQFGEGGAGTFSDGKLTSRSKHPAAREVLEIFCEHGAPDDILWQQRPHIGTDILRLVVEKMREEIIRLGGRFHFDCQLENLLDDKGKPFHAHAAEPNFSAVQTTGGMLPAHILVLATGHSARDTYRMLIRNGFELTPKPFAVGLRIEHPQEQVDLAQYGDEALARYGKPHVGGVLGPADYQLTWQDKINGSGVYSFCMCPGGKVVAASSVVGEQVVNGMSYRARDLTNANSAILCTVSPTDFGSGAEDGLYFQEMLERRAWLLGQGFDLPKQFDSIWQKEDQADRNSIGLTPLPPLPLPVPEAGKLPASAPVQLLGDFLSVRNSHVLGDVNPSFTPLWRFADCSAIFPDRIADSLRRGLTAFGQKFKGFGRADAVLSGVESRSSAPLRIKRFRDTMTATYCDRIYPIGEGSGYAGGIVSSAVDGLAAADAIVKRYRPTGNTKLTTEPATAG